MELSDNAIIVIFMYDLVFDFILEHFIDFVHYFVLDFILGTKKNSR